MNISILTDLLKWIGIAGGLVVGAGISAAAFLEFVKQALTQVHVVLSGPVVGIIASVSTAAVVAWTLGTAQGCPWWIAAVAAVVAVYVPHIAYNTAANQATQLAIRRAQLTAALKGTRPSSKPPVKKG
jgi:hypothetical protein